MSAKKDFFKKKNPSKAFIQPKNASFFFIIIMMSV